MRHSRQARSHHARARRSAGYASLCAVVTVLVSWGPAARAADPQDYTTTLRPTGNADLDDALRASSDLLSLQKTQAVSPFALTGRIHNDYSRLISALESYGYYAGAITITVTDGGGKSGASAAGSHDGRDPDLPEWMQSIPAGHRAQITISAQPGVQFRIGVVTLNPDKGDPPVNLNADEVKAFAMKSGMPAQAESVLSAGVTLQTALTEEGYALAHVSKPQAWLRPATHTLDIAYTVHRGPVVNLGAFDFAGLQRTHPAYIARRLTIAPGELYQPSRIERARQDIASTGLFADVQVNHGDTLASDGSMPLDFAFREGKRHSVGAEGGYSTDLGGRAGVTWTHNNLFGNAERLRLTALITGLGGSAEQGLGYDFYADLLKPDFGSRNQNMSARLEGIKQELYSYRQTALLARIGIVRRVNRHWNVSFGGQIEQEQIQQMGTTNSYFIAALPLTANYDGTGVDNPITPATHGVRMGASITPSASLTDGTSFFVIMQATVSTYFDLKNFGLSRPGRSVLAWRGTIGNVEGASTFDIPPDQRLYAGGSATVRGFRYQGVGPQFANTRYAIGGTSMDAGSFEYRQRIMQKFGAVGFIDAGQVTADRTPFQGTLRVGAGAGARYYTPIGPVRLDVAVPLNRPARGDKWELYVGLGETF
ncbi:BamA/TamA family outer membrane protein [Komagataeibacter oboediens]|uniref:autotransporter assembly complex protein TamA n=1 Tax=Komagataeibacter oboediens TaxID=65958 RepID=UPI0019064FF1|nr:BamA/TamA family outer membrane protein [Komagataeibacter oboediens]MBV0889874.1 BamA/TamA family outer membrane protein [Komagataeibacter oboediens]MBV1825452.1 BamA/TamA family outer membrane protein [Komagataeibacter oboediens]MCK9818803.1 BamA/TamA family outer membrane protein [Komagataeibacter oboediens]WEQ54022.1 BamA/TamA family outer membrane protein [Komagataeibacter oboediens]